MTATPENKHDGQEDMSTPLTSPTSPTLPTSPTTPTPASETITILNDVYISNEEVCELHEQSKLNVDELVNRLKQIYMQTSKPIEDIIDKFVENNYNVLETLKSFYTSRLVKPPSEEMQRPKSVNQLRMKEIRAYMGTREKLKQEQVQQRGSVL